MRTFLFLLAAAGLFTTPTRGADRPNILWISGDDHAPYVYGAYGNRTVRTPNLDRLANSGMRFDRAYCNSPVCTASRQSYLTGRYPRTVGVTQLSSVLPASERTLAEMLHDAGYLTGAIGKMHFNSSLKHGFDLRIEGQYHAWVKERGKSPLPPSVEVQPPWKPMRDPARIWLNSATRPVGFVETDMAASFFVEKTAAFLGEKRAQPFFLMVSFYEPHSPFQFPVEFRGRHTPSTFTVPKLLPQDEAQVPDIFRDLTDAEKQGIIAAYYTSTEFLDKKVGEVLDALEKSGQAANTIVVYTGDHGYMLGQHGRFEKHCGFEPAVRSPLVIRAPALARGKSTAALVEFIDVAPTLLDLAGVPIPSTVQGRSLVSLLNGKAREHRDQVIIEYSENEEAYLRDGRWKFMYGTGKRLRKDGYATGRPLPGRTLRMYDLKNDPEELHDLSAVAGQKERVARFVADLDAHLVRTARQPELIPKTTDVFERIDFCLQPHDVKAD